VINSCVLSLFNIFCILSAKIFSLVGNPIPEDKRYSSLKAMMRLYIGVDNRLTDINLNTTFYASNLVMVRILNILAYFLYFYIYLESKF
jgi:hypothetical protein